VAWWQAVHAARTIILAEHSITLAMIVAGLGCPRPSTSRFHAGGASLRRRTMVKETKFFRKQADKAERMARSATDVEISHRYLSMAHAYRSQAKVLKAKKKTEKKLR
jgi:hypothetical protein